MANVEAFFQLEAQRLRAEADMAAQWVSDKHWATVGTSRESALRRFIRGHLPSRLACGTGFVVGSSDGGRLSRQCDLLVYDPTVVAPLFAEEGFVVVRADAVSAVIEIKSHVDEKEFRDALDHVRSVKALNPDAAGGIFGLEGPKTKATIRRWLKAAAEAGVPHLGEGSDANSDLPALCLADFIHFVSGLQVETVRRRGELHRASVGCQKFDRGSGGALLYLLDWLLRNCRPTAADLPHLLEYLSIPRPKYPHLLTYESSSGRPPKGAD
jgi:hypothetical protein